jgi:hypothetical protein
MASPACFSSPCIRLVSRLRKKSAMRGMIIWSILAGLHACKRYLMQSGAARNRSAKSLAGMALPNHQP